MPVQEEFRRSVDIQTHISPHNLNQLETMVQSDDRYKSKSQFIREAVLEKINNSKGIIYDFKPTVKSYNRRIYKDAIINLFHIEKRPMHTIEITQKLDPNRSRSLFNNLYALVKKGVLLHLGTRKVPIKQSNGDKDWYKQQSVAYFSLPTQNRVDISKLIIKPNTIELTNAQLKIYDYLKSHGLKLTLDHMLGDHNLTIRKGKRGNKLLKDCLGFLIDQDLIEFYNGHYYAIETDKLVRLKSYHSAWYYRKKEENNHE